MDMKEKLLELIKQLDPELQLVVAEVIEKEREYMDMLKPKGIKEDIRDIIDKHVKYEITRGN